MLDVLGAPLETGDLDIHDGGDALEAIIEQLERTPVEVRRELWRHRGPATGNGETGSIPPR